ncbi:MAG: DUF1549 domain-containing protein [Akkermansiaceae bacterium]|nr:DUF1549 domain-containing protein [Akkermansiaceae bacterium]
MKRPLGVLLPAAILAMAGVGRAAEAAGHWAFQPLAAPPEPAVENGRWARNPVDRFILAGLEARGLDPVGEADPLTLLRRLTLDLTGLPPTLAEQDAFAPGPAGLTDESYGALVDRLLASPHYGERWGRHWLDVARYVQGKTKVAAVDRVDMAEPYRDYVVRAFNADKPFDRFVIEQIAGDLLPETGDRSANLDQRIAPSFLSIGPWFADCADPNSLRMDIIDEQIGTTTQAFLGMNFSCARCHDHFFDPVPTRDYYALAGIFGSTRILKENSKNWRDGRFLLTQPEATPEEIAADRKVRERIAALRQERWKALAAARQGLLDRVQPRLGDYDRALDDLAFLPAVEIEAEDYNGQNNVRRAALGGGMVVETQRERLQWVGWRADLPEAGTYTVWLRCAAPESYAVELKLDGKSVLEDHPLPATGGWDEEHFRWVSLGPHLFRKGSNDVRLWAQDHSYLPRLDKLRFLRTPPNHWHLINGPAKRHGLEHRVLAELHVDRTAWPPNVADAERFVEVPALAGIDAAIARLEAGNPKLPRMPAVTDHDRITDEPVHVAGDVYNVGDEPVPRGVPTFANDLLASPAMPPDASGRLELAQWIANPRNPLTARVIANRVWQGHFGRGLVETPGDFGIQGQPPVNQPLLDWLARYLIDNDWSLKALHRVIVTSSTYRRSSGTNAAAAAVDPDNKLLGRYPRRRLEAEALYDGMLASIGKVPRQPSGQALDNKLSKDRAMYILTSGRSPLGMGMEIRKMLHLFGYDPSGVPVHRRDHSASAAQSLFWLNNKLPRYYATKLAGRLLAIPDLNDEDRVTRAFRTIIGRPPGPGVMEDTFTYLDHCRVVQGLGETESWSRVCLGIFSSDAYLYIE